LKERIFVVRFRKIFRKNNIVGEPLVEVGYTDANNIKHKIESFVDKESNMGLVAGELIHRLVPQLGDR